MTTAFDLLVIGAGPAGGNAALEAASAGLTVALIDEGTAAGGQVWRAPRTAIAPILLALALGALGGTATLIALPEVLGTAHARLAASTY
jgi:NADPH-dependent 2,4-dienoyl-CoA reductase/sulfur reductase-like enzyme